MKLSENFSLSELIKSQTAEMVSTMAPTMRIIPVTGNPTPVVAIT